MVLLYRKSHFGLQDGFLYAYHYYKPKEKIHTANNISAGTTWSWTLKPTKNVTNKYLYRLDPSIHHFVQLFLQFSLKDNFSRRSFR